MAEQTTSLILSIGAEPIDDTQEGAELAQLLMEDLLETGVESVEHVRDTETPAGAKGDPITLATLAVTLGPTALKGLMSALQSWLTRHERTSIVLIHGDRRIIVKGTLSKDQQQMIADWLHSK
jgi:hypothetical protein